MVLLGWDGTGPADFTTSSIHECCDPFVMYARYGMDITWSS